MLFTLFSGALAGLLHVLSGPDHLAAVAPIAINDGRRGWLAGWTWGLGHTTGVVCVAALAVLLRDWLPPLTVLSEWSERLVGVALIGVGLWAFRGGFAIAPGPHRHDDIVHRHLYVQQGPTWLRRLGHAHASFYLGILHGVAGSSHFFGVLPALALPSRGDGLAYITAFGAGTVAAMTVFAALAGLTGARFASLGMQRALMRTASIAAVVVGGIWLLT